MQLRTLVLITTLAAACDSTVSGNQPVGGSVDTEAELQRFLRRANLDLAGKQPDQAVLDAATLRLRDAGNTPGARGELVAEMLATPAFTDLWVEELENGIFGGSTVDQHYLFVCALVRAGDAACNACTETDACLCACPQLDVLEAERTMLRTSAADLASGTSTSALEQRYAMARGYFALSPSPEGRVTALFDDFLARAPEPDELENGRSMVIFQDGFLNGAPVGLLFHRHATNYADMIDIIFGSEVYREAMVRRAFERYLARSPSPAELAHFTTTLDANEPDMRPLVQAIVSSREYFEQ